MTLIIIGKRIDINFNNKWNIWVNWWIYNDLYQEDIFEEKYCLEYLYKSTKDSKIDVISFGLLNKEKKSLILKC